MRLPSGRMRQSVVFKYLSELSKYNITPLVIVHWWTAHSIVNGTACQGSSGERCALIARRTSNQSSVIEEKKKKKLTNTKKTNASFLLKWFTFRCVVVAFAMTVTARSAVRTDAARRRHRSHGNRSGVMFFLCVVLLFRVLKKKNYVIFLIVVHSQIR